jgi:hypothetical protein
LEIWLTLPAINDDGKFNFGWPEPIEFSKRFSFHPDTLHLRPQWEVTDLIFRLM